ncbi:MAG: HAD-IB family hydrolase [Gammaproteobacteria bacterium]|nr:HAD-IB family hydrolase [Gammaproteobacteria bacterium]MDH5727778.1 HAD-IB family hydrolase [Gammaproteobacteria bacterium]
MALAIFDLDNTLIAGDSDYAWGQYLVRQGIVDGEFYERENKRFYDEYKAGTLDIFEFLRFSLKPLSQHPMQQLLELRATFIQSEIEPMLLHKAKQLVENHRAQGDTLMIITATNRFVTEPIAKLYGIEILLATDPALENGQYTGEVAGVPCFQLGKVTRLNQWLENQQADLKDSWFYSDSHNDIPLLELVEHPVAVDADEKLTHKAKQSGWQLMSLRD